MVMTVKWPTKPCPYYVNTKHQNFTLLVWKLSPSLEKHLVLVTSQALSFVIQIIVSFPPYCPDSIISLPHWSSCSHQPTTHWGTFQPRLFVGAKEWNCQGFVVDRLSCLLKLSPIILLTKPPLFGLCCSTIFSLSSGCVHVWNLSWNGTWIL